MWYDTGTVAVTNGSTTVTGTGTDFISGAQVGEAFLAPDDKLYEIQSITSATVLVLADPYLGSTQSGQEYKIVPTQSLVADLASQVTDLITDYSDVKDTAGAGKFNDGTVTAPAITFEQDQNNGLYRIGNDNYGLSAGGVKQVDISSTDVELNHSGSKKLSTTATGVDVTGTVTADGLTVENTSSAPQFTFASSHSSGIPLLALKGQASAQLRYIDETDTVQTRLDFADNGKVSIVNGSGNKRLVADSNGDISFYEDTGTTAKMVWDASEEQLNLTGSVSGKVPFRTYSGGYTADYNSYSAEEGFQVMSYQSDGGSPYTKTSDLIANADGTAPSEMRLLTKANGSSNPTERLRIDSSGNVGIGCSPSSQLHISSATPIITLTDTDTGADHEINANSSFGNLIISADKNAEGSSRSLQLHVGGSERARIDSSGNLLVGGTSLYQQNAFTFRNDGWLYVRRDSNTVQTLRRDGTDGHFMTFDKEGSTVGSIGVDYGSEFYVGGTQSSGLYYSSSSIRPTSGGDATTLIDNTVTLGSAAHRFKDLYLSGGVYLGGTGSANKLDDYETGDYDATLTCSSSGTITLQATNNRIAYTKIGRTVHIQGRLIVDSVSSPVGYIKLNLPFAVANLTDSADLSKVVAFTTGAVSVGSSDIAGFTQQSSSEVRLYNASGALSADSAQQMQANTTLYFNFSYITTA